MRDKCLRLRWCRDIPTTESNNRRNGMGRVSRREFIKQAASCGAALAWGATGVHASNVSWRERRDLFPEGVASGDPDFDSVLLWTRRPLDKGERHMLTV